MPSPRSITTAALALGSALLALAVLEGIFRVAAISSPAFSAESIWEEQSGAGTEDDFEALVVGNVRFRDEVPDPAVFEPGVRRVLLLGDSFTEGAGVPRAADRFGDLVESWLNEELAASGSPQRVHVFNAGKGASSPVRWVAYQRFFAAWYRPDAVVAVFFLRDGAPLSTSLKLNRAIIEPIRRRWRARPLYEESALLRFFYERFAWREYDREFRRRLTAAYLGSGPERDYWGLQQAALREMADDCRARGIPFHLVIFPMLLELDAYPFFEVERAIEAFAAEAGIPSFSLTPGFEGLEDHTLWVAPNDQHPNEEGHRVAAATLLPYLGREVLGLPAVAGR
jgi:lysophospholipase L1-like esterase